MRKIFGLSLFVSILATIAGCGCYNCSEWEDSYHYDWDYDHYGPGYEHGPGCGCAGGDMYFYDDFGGEGGCFDPEMCPNHDVGPGECMTCYADEATSGCECYYYQCSDYDDVIEVKDDDVIVNGDDGKDELLDEGASYARACHRDATCYEGERCVDGFCKTQEQIDSGVSVEAECQVNDDCAAGDICTEGRCIPCQTDACDTSKEVECVFSSQCESGLCVDGACMPAGACAIDANCAEGQICVDHACIARPECLADSECGEGQICNASNACEDDVECRIDSDCGEGLICVSNMCAQCRLNCECPNEGDICMNGACVADERAMKD